MVEESFQEKVFTQKGIDTFSHLLDSYLQIFNDKSIKYPTGFIIFGVPNSQFDSESDLYGRIKLLSSLLQIKVNIKFVEETLSDNSKKIRCYIEKIN